MWAWLTAQHAAVVSPGSERTVAAAQHGDPILHVSVRLARVLVRRTGRCAAVGAIRSMVAGHPNHKQKQRAIRCSSELRVCVECWQNLLLLQRQPAERATSREKRSILILVAWVYTVGAQHRTKTFLLGYYWRLVNQLAKRGGRIRVPILMTSSPFCARTWNT